VRAAQLDLPGSEREEDAGAALAKGAMIRQASAARPL
jgi:hypothetical protein